MDKQMQSMQEMRNKLLAARTPEERSKLMAEQMKLMQGGMDMMMDRTAPAPAVK